jgi:hypothetical protein
MLPSTLKFLITMIACAITRGCGASVSIRQAAAAGAAFFA